VTRILAAVMLVGAALAAAAEAAALRWASISPALTFGAPFARDEGGALRWQFYDSLSIVTGQGELKPGLAESWTLENPTTWVLKLRPGVAFSNGEPFDAAAAAAAINTLTDPAQRFPRAFDVPGIAGARARDAFTLEITTQKPDPILIRRLNMVPIPAPKAWAEMGVEAFAKNPIGTGPFKIVQWGAAEYRLTMVPTSWRKSRHITDIEIRVITDAAARIKALLSGRVDIASGLGPDDIDTVKAAGYAVRVMPVMSVLSIAYRTVRDENVPLKDVRVRQALNYAIDKESIVTQITAGTTRVANQGTVPGVPGFNPDLPPYPYDPAKAKAMLAEAGYPDGFKLVIAVYSGLLPNDTTIFQKVAQDLAAVGVRVELRSMTFPDYARRLFNGEWQGIDAFSNGWLSVGVGDPIRAVDQFSCGYSATFFCEPSMMPLIEATRTEMDPATRTKMMQEIMAEFNRLGVALWLVEFSQIAGISPRVKNFQTRSDGIGIEFESIGLTDRE
jgi:peptide/nickel transport system substrate-binding protein